MLRNPKYTGYQVFGRTQHGKPVPPGQWHWSPAPTHPAIVDRATWDDAQEVGAEHATSWGDTRSRTPPPGGPICCGPGSGARSASGAWSAAPKPTPAATPKATTPTSSAPTTAPTPATSPRPPTIPAPSPPATTSSWPTLRAAWRPTPSPPAAKNGSANCSPPGPIEQQARTDAQAAALKARLKQIDHRPGQPRPRPRHPAHRPRPTPPRWPCGPASTPTSPTCTTNTKQKKPSSRPSPGKPRPVADLDLIDLLPTLPGRFHELPRTHPGRTVHRPGHPGPLERPPAPGHLLRHHHRHHPRRHQRPARPRRRRPHHQPGRARSTSPDQQQPRGRIHSPPYVLRMSAGLPGCVSAGALGPLVRPPGRRRRDGHAARPLARVAPTSPAGHTGPVYPGGSNELSIQERFLAACAQSVPECRAPGGSPPPPRITGHIQGSVLVWTSGLGPGLSDIC